MVFCRDVGCNTWNLCLFLIPFPLNGMLWLCTTWIGNSYQCNIFWHCFNSGYYHLCPSPWNNGKHSSFSCWYLMIIWHEMIFFCHHNIIWYTSLLDFEQQFLSCVFFCSIFGMKMFSRKVFTSYISYVLNCFATFNLDIELEVFTKGTPRSKRHPREAAQAIHRTSSLGDKNNINAQHQSSQKMQISRPWAQLRFTMISTCADLVVSYVTWLWFHKVWQLCREMLACCMLTSCCALKQSC